MNEIYPRWVAAHGDLDVQQEVRNVALSVARQIALQRSGRAVEPDVNIDEPRPK